ncbi:MAG TPA: CDP-archaeol synthase [Chromatiaceae bacterium]|nr:CDP-archaeol synthase [Chromatiaceae bacterium]
MTLDLLWLLVLVNGSPLLPKMLLPEGPVPRPLDGGRRLADGRRLWGASKTVRGAVIMLLVAVLFAPLLGLPYIVGVVVGPLALAGDLLSSFIKRRMGLRSGAMAPGLDQIPESLLPLLACKPLLGLEWSTVFWVTLLFLAADLLLSRLFWLLGFREHPH